MIFVKPARLAGGPGWSKDQLLIFADEMALSKSEKKRCGPNASSN